MLFMTAMWPGVSSILAAVVVLGILVFAHELGHFLVAKLSGVGVLKFSLGFGKKVVGWKVGETEYIISALPLGGYVKMLGGEGESDETEEELTPEQQKRTFTAQPVWKRLAIVVAGPVFNIILAVVLCYIIFVTGFPTAVSKVMEVVPGSPAQAAGFKSGDIIEKIDGEPVNFWEEAADYIKKHPGKDMVFEVRRGRDTVSLKAKSVPEDGKGYVGLLGSAVIAAVMENSPADKAGMRSKDRVVAVDGKKVGSWNDMAEAVKLSPGRLMDFTLDRDGKQFDVKVTPIVKQGPETGGKAYGIIGVQAGAETEKLRYGPVESIGMSAERTLYMTGFTVNILTRIIKGKEDASQLGGPVMIVQISGRQAREGFADFVLFMALLSINLGVINLFPIPILDGGLLMFLAIEGITRKPLSIRMREVAQQIGLFLLIALMVFVFYNDIMRLLGFQPMWK